jgi:hypothetical protein
MGHCCRIFTPAQPVYPAASVRDFLSGALRRTSATTASTYVKSDFIPDFGEGYGWNKPNAEAWSRIGLKDLPRQFVGVMCLTSINDNSNQSKSQNSQTSLCLPNWVLGVVDLGVHWSVVSKIFPRDGHKPKTNWEVVTRDLTGLTFVLVGLSLVPLTYWLAGA